jgi:hypothetical protein
MANAPLLFFIDTNGLANHWFQTGFDNLNAISAPRHYMRKRFFGSLRNDGHPKSD